MAQLANQVVGVFLIAYIFGGLALMMWDAARN